MLRFRLFAFVLITLSFVLAACADEGSASDAVENYLKAKIASDADKLTSLSCKDWEAQALLDAAPFESVDAKFDGMSCKEAGKEDQFTLVTCEGTLSFEYQGELRKQNLSEVSYLTIKENGEWKMCGEKE
jgi:hypothetical protein